MRTWIGRLLVLGFMLAVGYMVATRQPEGESPAQTAPAATTDDVRILDAFRDRRSDVWVETVGRVERLLADDREGSRHQRFIIGISGGHTLLVSHNIDLAPRVPLEVDDTIELRGEYEWNERGGVVHWTHHDPQGRLPGGWIRHADKLYR